MGVDLAHAKGSGPGRQITAADVRRAKVSAATDDAFDNRPAPGIATTSSAGDRIPFRGVRRMIACSDVCESALGSPCANAPCKPGGRHGQGLAALFCLGTRPAWL